METTTLQMGSIDWDAPGDDEQETALRSAHLQCQLLDLKEQLQIFGREKTALQQTLVNAATEREAEAQKLRKKLQDVHSEKFNLASRLKGVEKQVEELNHELAEARKSSGVSEGGLQRVLQERGKEVPALNTEIRALRGKLQASREEQGRVHHRHRAMGGLVKALEQQQGSLRTMLTDLVKRADSASMSGYEGRLQSVLQAYEVLKGQANAREASMQKLRGMCREKDSSLSQALQHAKETETALATRGQEVASLSESNSRLSERLQSCQQSNSQLLGQLKAQEEALSAATLTSESQQASLSSLEQKLAQIIASFQSASEKDAEQIAHLRSKVLELTAKIPLALPQPKKPAEEHTGDHSETKGLPSSPTPGIPSAPPKESIPPATGGLSKAKALEANKGSLKDPSASAEVGDASHTAAQGEVGMGRGSGAGVKVTSEAQSGQRAAIIEAAPAEARALASLTPLGPPSGQSQTKTPAVIRLPWLPKGNPVQLVGASTADSTLIKGQDVTNPGSSRLQIKADLPSPALPHSRAKASTGNLVPALQWGGGRTALSGSGGIAKTSACAGGKGGVPTLGLASQCLTPARVRKPQEVHSSPDAVLELEIEVDLEGSSPITPRKHWAQRTPQPKPLTPQFKTPAPSRTLATHPLPSSPPQQTPPAIAAPESVPDTPATNSPPCTQTAGEEGVKIVRIKSALFGKPMLAKRLASWAASSQAQEASGGNAKRPRLGVTKAWSDGGAKVGPGSGGVTRATASKVGSRSCEALPAGVRQIPHSQAGPGRTGEEVIDRGGLHGEGSLDGKSKQGGDSEPHAVAAGEEVKGKEHLLAGVLDADPGSGSAGSSRKEASERLPDLARNEQASSEVHIEPSLLFNCLAMVDSDPGSDSSAS